jgi:hypothetical protein
VAVVDRRVGGQLFAHEPSGPGGFPGVLCGASDLARFRLADTVRALGLGRALANKRRRSGVQAQAPACQA